MKKEQIKKWLKNPYNALALVVIAISFFVRLYYLNLASGQTLWWDEAEYMATAKHWAFGVPYDLNPQRPPLFQLLGAFLLKIGLGEASLKFFLVLLPSVALVAAVYFLGKEMFDEKIGLLAALGTSFVWSLLFWTSRFQPDFFSVTFQVLAVLFFWKLFKENKTKYAIYGGAFTALGFYFKISALLVPLSLFIFILFRDKISFIKNKKYWIALLSFIVVMLPFAIWQLSIFGNPLAFAPSYSGSFNEGRALGWMALSFFQIFPKSLFFFLFLFGAAITLGKILLSFDLVMKEKSKRTNPWILSAVFLIVTSAFYVFYIKGTIEDRWIFLIIPFIMFFSSKGLLTIVEKTKKYHKYLPAAIIIFVFAFFIYAQLGHTSSLVENKKSSYAPIREASILVKDISSPEDKFLSISYTQSTAYSEREVITYAKMSEEEFFRILEEERPKYILVSILEPHHPEWILQQGIQNGNRIIAMPYFNSTIAISPQGQIVYYDVKNSITDRNYRYELIYPEGQFNGAFLYKINYN